MAMGLFQWVSRGALISWVLASVLVRAQTGTGSIQGTVRDTTGAVIPGAKVVLVQSQTAVTFSGQTNSAGF
jgi:hypothetical protein